MKRILAIGLTLVFITLSLTSCAGTNAAIAGKDFSFDAANFIFPGTEEEFYEADPFHENAQGLIEDLLKSLAFNEFQEKLEDNEIHFSKEKGADNCTLNGKSVKSYLVNYIREDEFHVSELCTYIPVESADYEYHLYKIVSNDTGYEYQPFDFLNLSSFSSETSHGETLVEAKKMQATEQRVYYDQANKKLYMDFEIVLTITSGDKETQTKITCKTVWNEQGVNE